MKALFKKINILAFHRDKEKISSMLQELGVVHLELNHDFRNESVEELEHQKNRFNKAIEAIQECEESEIADEDFHDPEKLSAYDAVENVLTWKEREDQNKQERETLYKDKQKLLPWGDFDYDKISLLKQSGIAIQFCIAGKKEFRNHDFDELSYQVIQEGPDQIYFVAAFEAGAVSLPFEIIDLPPMSISDIIAKEEELKRNCLAITREIKSYFPCLKYLHDEQIRIEDDLTFLIANGSYDEHQKGSILSLQGWFPITEERRLLHKIQSKKLTYSVSDPQPGDEVPVLLKNPGYSGLFEPVTKIFQLPNYYEMDLTPFIAVFYPILFAYCLGDAGYGLVLLLSAVVSWFTFLKSFKNMAILGLILGGFTTVMGIVKSGSIFGIPIADKDSNIIFQYFAQYVIIPDERNFIFNAFNVALMIGVIQILVGIALSIINKIRFSSFLEALPRIGKFLIVTSLIWIFLADMQEVEMLRSFSWARKAFLLAGVVLVLFFHDLKLPVLHRAAGGLLPLFFIFTGILGDVLSYVRLFALGVASAVLGLVVNQIGMQIIGESWWGLLVGVIFLLVGHGLNFALATLGAFVHPLRLTFVEFYNNAQFEGGGIEYNPFRKH